MPEATIEREPVYEIDPETNQRVIKFDQERPPSPGSHQVPRPYKGQMVIYHQDGIQSEHGVPAVVLSVGMESHLVSLRVLDGVNQILPVKDAVRHVANPLLKKDIGDGAWSHVAKQHNR